MPSPNYSQRALSSIFATDPAGSDPTIPIPGFFSGPAVGSLITPASGSFGIVVAPAVWVLAGGAPVSVGSVLWCPPGNIGQTLAAAHATLPRHDLITAQVVDPGSSTAAGSSDIVIVTGTPATVPVDPTAPTGALIIGRVRVRAASTSIIAGDIDDLRNPTALRNDQPVPGWDMSSLAGSHTIGNNSATGVHFNALNEAQDVTVTTSPGAATIIVPGRYLVGFRATFLAGGSVGLRQATITVNRASSAIRRFKGGSSAENGIVWMGAAGTIRLQTGDLVFATVLQVSGGNLSLDDTDLTTQFTGSWLGA